MLNDKSGSLLLEECTTLKKYHYSLIQDIESQIEYVEQLIDEIKEANVLSEETSLNYAFLNFYKKRCERILAAYFYSRFLLTNDQNLDLLSENEREKWTIVNEAEMTYFESFPDIDFKMSDDPPDQIYVHIVCLKDCGLIYDDEDLMEMVTGRIYFVKKKSVEHLIKEDSVEILNDL
ncbi:DNA replication complex GINS protein PSF1 [Vairimorpha necatrix]|uniref:DNA replication complex GINS protein PSF1 n=1 Tax=Vairimorpha necatrix TaxID=6039 RepID=A0AAX4JDT2_9MICR